MGERVDGQPDAEDGEEGSGAVLDGFLGQAAAEQASDEDSQRMFVIEETAVAPWCVVWGRQDGGRCMIFADRTGHRVEQAVRRR
jgi:hypothetical protein